jgi:hypothetical protein
VTPGVIAAASSASSNVEPGVLGFLVVAGIGVALVFLLRSMNKQFRKITPVPGPESADGTGSGGEVADGASAGSPAAGPGAADGVAVGQDSKAPARTPE